MRSRMWPPGVASNPIYAWTSPWRTIGVEVTMFEQAFRNIDDVLRKEAGCTTELDYKNP
jgi:hypothetical protein